MINRMLHIAHVTTLIDYSCGWGGGAACQRSQCLTIVTLFHVNVMSLTTKMKCKR